MKFTWPEHLRIPPPPKDRSFMGWFEWKFKMKERGSTFSREIRAGCILFLVSVFSVLLNPVILSGAASGYNTGMPKTDVALATAISSGVGTLVMAIFGNYPWVLGVQLGTNNYFVDTVLGQETCGYNAFFTPGDQAICPGQPCSCSPGPNGTQIVDQVGTAENPGPCFGTKNICLGSKIPYQQALAATFLEGLVFLLICLTGLRAFLLKRIPRCILISGATGIGLFIMFVGWKGMGVVVADKYPTLVRLNTEVQYGPTGWGDGSVSTGIGFNSCVMVNNMAPFGPVCPWLAVGGLVFTAILVLWNIPSALIAGTLFTTFISWIVFPQKVPVGLVPNQVAYLPKFTETAGALSFHWGDNTGKLIAAFVTFLYLDFIGSAITFCSLGQMAGILDDKGDIPNSNIAFMADAIASMMGGLLGSSAIVCYVESATGMREGGRTGFAALIAAVLFFMSSFLSPLFGQIPTIATSPILVIVGVLIFASAVCDINWEDMSEAIPALVTTTIMPFTSNIAYARVIGGIGAYVVCKFFTYQLHPWQQKWPGVALYQKWSQSYSLFMPIRGWNCDTETTMSYEAAIKKAMGSKYIEPPPASPVEEAPSASSDDVGKLEAAEKGSRGGVPGESAHGGVEIGEFRATV